MQIFTQRNNSQTGLVHIIFILFYFKGIHVFAALVRTATFYSQYRRKPKKVFTKFP